MGHISRGDPYGRVNGTDFLLGVGDNKKVRQKEYEKIVRRNDRRING